MGLAPFVFIAAQTPLKREIRAGLERKYRVEVVQEAGDQVAYRLRTKIVDPKARTKTSRRNVPKGTKAEPPGPFVLELRLTDYRATLDGQKVSAATIGGGQLPIGANGLPSGLNVTGTQGPMWLPILAFYFPDDGAEGAFVIVPTPVGQGLELVGSGTLNVERDRRTIKLDASLATGDKKFAKLTMTTTVDGAGWPEKAEGTFVSEDGTYRITLVRG